MGRERRVRGRVSGGSGRGRLAGAGSARGAAAFASVEDPGGRVQPEGVDALPRRVWSLPPALLRVAQLFSTGFSGSSFLRTVSPAPAWCPGRAGGAIPVYALLLPGGRRAGVSVASLGQLGHVAPGDLCRFPLGPAGVTSPGPPPPNICQVRQALPQFPMGAAFFHLFSGHFAFFFLGLVAHLLGSPI